MHFQTKGLLFKSHIYEDVELWIEIHYVIDRYVDLKGCLFLGIHKCHLIQELI